MVRLYKDSSGKYKKSVCEISCFGAKKSKNSNKQIIECNPVFKNNRIIGAKWDFPSGKDDILKLCPKGCDQNDLKNFETTKKCKAKSMNGYEGNGNNCKRECYGVQTKYNIICKCDGYDNCNYFINLKKCKKCDDVMIPWDETDTNGDR